MGRLVAALLAAATATACLHGLGAILPGPALGEPATWGTWLVGVGPEAAVATVLRVALLPVAWYLLLALSLGMFVRLAGAVRLAARLDAVTTAGVRRLVHAALGAATAGLVAVTPALGPSPVLAAPGTAAEATVGDQPAVPLPLRLAADGAGTAPRALRAVGHRVVAGDSFWRLAADRLAAAWGRPPDDAEVVVHWRLVIEHNRDRLADRADPDLLLPGQELTLPAVPVDPAVP